MLKVYKIYYKLFSSKMCLTMLFYTNAMSSKVTATQKLSERNIHKLLLHGSYRYINTILYFFWTINKMNAIICYIRSSIL